jgi:hypothetical protein
MQEQIERLQAVSTELGVEADFEWHYNAVMEAEGWHLSALQGERVDEWLGHSIENAIEAFEARFNRVFYP